MGQDGTAASRAAALRVVRDEFAQAIAATKCHRCGCLRHTIEALEKAAPAVVELIPVLDSARRVLVPQKYECLGCEICFPALAANAFSGAFPQVLSGAALCPVEAPEERSGVWPE